METTAIEIIESDILKCQLSILENENLLGFKKKERDDYISTARGNQNFKEKLDQKTQRISFYRNEIEKGNRQIKTYIQYWNKGMWLINDK